MIYKETPAKIISRVKKIVDSEETTEAMSFEL